ncbi:MAG: SulP family inorganic anion transporter [Acidimicrobiia bacterium]|nr:SulP family inorganic anion transporter [Acidimicrobiia bacterium]
MTTDTELTGWRRFAPGIAGLSSYERSWFRPDILAGATVWAMLVPQALGYASLAGMPTVYGLYAAIGGLALYWIWGTSRELNVGPESTVAIMVATILTPLAASGSEEYLALAAMLAILVGLVLLVGGLLRLGRIADFLSRPILAGYVFGSGLLIVVSQLPDLLGIDVDSSLYATDIGAIVRNLDQTDGLTLTIGLATILIVVGLRSVNRAIPGALVAVIVAMLAVWLFDLDVEVVGEFASGVPIPGVPDVGISDVGSLVLPAVAVALLVYPDSVLTGRSLATLKGYRLDPNQEFYGIGAANIGSGLLGGFAVNGSQSRSYVLADAGAKSQVANLWAVGLILLTLLFLAPVFEYLPTAALAGIVIVAGFGLLDVSDFRALWKYRRSEFWAAVFTTAAVLILGMLGGIVVAVVLSLLATALRSASPSTAVLGRLPGTNTYRDIEDHPDAETFEGLVIYRFDAPLFFANSGTFRDEVTELALAPDAHVTRVIVDAEAIYDIDSTAAQVLLELTDNLDAEHVELAMARVRTEIADELVTIRFTERIVEGEFFLEVDDAVLAYLATRADDG